MVASGFKWMFLILGTMIGAGYASGRELWQFFGDESALAIILFSILFTLSLFVVMSISRNMRTQHYTPVLIKLLGEKMAILYDGLIFFYLFSTTVIMIAGGGAALEVLNIPYWGGIIFISLCLIGLFIAGNKGLVTMNTIVIPLLIVCLLGLLIKFTNGADHALQIHWDKQSNWHAAFTFTSLNVVSLVAVLGGVGGEIKSKGEIWIASIGSGLILGAISFIYNQSLLHVASEMPLYEIPLFALLKDFPYVMTITMSGLLWFAIFTTAASGMFGLTTRLRSRFNGPLWLLTLILTLCMVPLTTLGFSTLIAVLYPIYGILNLYFLACILIYPIMSLQPKSST
ncbi:hypothetical protein PU629_00075 [Pullulanibacillus sp. KACC 23026]|nr:hypothetical protein [Pullulanibacillus sp. KACC 23026]WEG15062.1 hypothetical protein PU629_00075 [Pullulanibacillus sp. KACC 23026]